MPGNRDEIALTGHAIAGLIDAEAHLFISEMNGGRTLSCGLTLAVRDDDVELRCTVELGRFPGPTEYARWRLHNDPNAPSFATAYRLFPGGWGEIHAAMA